MSASSWIFMKKALYPNSKFQELVIGILIGLIYPKIKTPSPKFQEKTFSPKFQEKHVVYRYPARGKT